MEYLFFRCAISAQYKGCVFLNKIRNEIKLLKDNIQRVNDDKYSDIFTNISDILDRLSDKVEDLMVNQKVIAENINYMNEDISGLQDELFG